MATPQHSPDLDPEISKRIAVDIPLLDAFKAQNDAAFAKALAGVKRDNPDSLIPNRPGEPIGSEVIEFLLTNLHSFDESVRAAHAPMLKRLFAEGAVPSTEDITNLARQGVPNAGLVQLFKRTRATYLNQQGLTEEKADTPRQNEMIARLLKDTTAAVEAYALSPASKTKLVADLAKVLGVGVVVKGQKGEGRSRGGAGYGGRPPTDA